MATPRRALRQLLLLVGAAACTIAAAGCGSSGVASTSTAAAPCPPRARVRRHVSRVAGDLAKLRRAAATGSHAATSRATDRFLLDVAYEPPLRRNRLLDRAAAAVVGVCDDCFQALEAMRPIPALKYGGAC
jgi:hypothetical protein